MNFKIRRCIQFFLWIVVIGMFLGTAFWLKAEINQAQPMDPPLSEEQAEQQTQKGSFDLDGLKSVISAAGMLSFALGYINSAKRQKVKGILMGEVIAQAYPHYGYIFIFHGIFVLVGLYSCTAGYINSALCCTIGVLSCLLFTVVMALEVALSERGQERLVRAHIEHILDNLKAGQNEDQIELREQYVRAMAQYVGQRFLLRDWLIERHDNKRGLFSDIGDVAQLLKLPDLYWSEASIEVLDIRKEFSRLFTKTSAETSHAAKEPRPQYILAMIPDIQQQKQRFQQSVLLYAEMWRNMMVEENAPHRKKELVYRILSMNDGKFTSFALCCGLLLYLTDSSFYDTAESNHRAIQLERNSFLLEINNQRELDLKQSQSAAVSTGQKNMGTICWNLCLINFALSMFEQVFNPDLLDVLPISDIVHQFLEEETRLGVKFYRSSNDLCLYLSFAYIIAEMYNIIHRVDLIRAVPDMVEIIREEIDRGGAISEL